MLLTTKNGTIEIKVGDTISVCCRVADRKEKFFILGINGHCGSKPAKIVLSVEDFQGKYLNVGDKISMPFEVVWFQGKNPVIKYSTKEIVLNGTEHIITDKKSRYFFCKNIRYFRWLAFILSVMQKFSQSAPTSDLRLKELKLRIKVLRISQS